jgi:hypothetical protein
MIVAVWSATVHYVILSCLFFPFTCIVIVNYLNSGACSIEIGNVASEEEYMCIVIVNIKWYYLYVFLKTELTV